MADDQNPEEEPSIEEILDSIRQIISDDEEEAADAPAEDDAVIEQDPTPKEEPASEPEPETASEPEPAAVEEESDPFADDPEEEVVELTEKIDEPEPATAEEEPKIIPESEATSKTIEDNDEIIRGLAEAAALEGFGELVKKTAVEANGITIEEIVRTELKPLLREWLDNHLPSIIERLVKEELERVSKRVLEDV